MSASHTHATGPGERLVDCGAVAQMLGCSPRHVYRLASSGLMPPPVRIGHLSRWDREVVEEWIVSGCQAVLNEGEVSR